MDKTKKIKLFIGLFYIFAVSLFLYFIFTKFSFQEITSYEFIKNNRNFFFELRQSNLFLLGIIKIISRLIIILSGIFPRKTKIKSKPDQNILYGNKLNNKLEKLLGDILPIKKIDETLEDCNLIFDSNYLTNKEIINCVDKLKNRNKINFWFLSSDYSYIIRASGMNQKGNAIFL